MFNCEDSPQLRGEFVCIEDLAPEDHLSRKIERHINFSFVWQKHKEQIRENILTPSGKYLRRKRRETVERSFRV